MPLATTAPAARKPRNLLAPGNSKLGLGVFSFTMPAIATCPGRSGRCSRLCYADRGLYQMPSNRRSHLDSYTLSQRDDFPAAMTRAVRRAYAQVVRVHTGGDFYDAAYARKWHAIAAACPATTFYAYTRSWRVAEILPALRELAMLPNFQLWFSEDRETGDSPPVPGVRRAFLVADRLDAMVVPEASDLVFRDKAHHADGQVKRLGGVLVCPFEQSEDLRARVTCASCRICFTAPRSTRA